MIRNKFHLMIKEILFARIAARIADYMNVRQTKQGVSNMVSDLVRNYTALISCVYEPNLLVEQSLVAQGINITVPKKGKLDDYIDVIRHQYLVEEYSFAKLAKEYKTGMRKIREFLIEHDIKIRSRGKKKLIK